MLVDMSSVRRGVAAVLSLHVSSVRRGVAAVLSLHVSSCGPCRRAHIAPSSD